MPYIDKRTVEQHNARSLKYRNRRRERIHKLLGNKCAHCGNDDPRTFQVDHINANHGLDQDDPGRGGQNMYLRILNGTYPVEDFQLLCANCNQIKKWENEEYLPQRVRVKVKRASTLFEEAMLLMIKCKVIK